jgi:hypothetical protein
MDELLDVAAMNVGKILGVLVAGSLVITLLWYVWYRPEHPFVFVQSTPSYQPQNEAGESWVRL